MSDDGSEYDDFNVTAEDDILGGMRFYSFYKFVVELEDFIVFIRLFYFIPMLYAIS